MLFHCFSDSGLRPLPSSLTPHTRSPSLSLSSQVHHAPGGSSQLDLFGGYAEAEARATAPRAVHHAPAVIPAAAAAPAPAARPLAARNTYAPAPAATAAAATTAVPAKRSGVSSNVWASGANQNCGNFISDRATTRVLSAPGGNSTIQLW